MKFIYPEFLYALTAISIPVIIHLFNFRRYKKVYFSNVRFLKEIKEQTQSRSRIRHILVLIARILTIIFLVFAFAQPFIPGSLSDEVKGDKLISVYIDNSFSMEVEGANGWLIDVAKEKAREIASEYSATDQFQLVTNDFEGIQQRIVSREEFTEMVDEVKISHHTRKLSEVLSRQLDVLNEGGARSKRIIWISDFQKTSSDFEKISGRETPRVVCLPLSAQKQNNVYIDSVWFATPVHQLRVPEKLTVRVRNNGDELVENSSLQLVINGKQKAISNFSVEAGGYTDSTLYFTNTEPGLQHAKVFLPDVQVKFDDSYFFSYLVQEKVNVLTLTGDKPEDTSSAVARLFGNDPYFRLTNQRATRLDYSTLSSFNLVVLSDLPSVSSGLSAELSKYLRAGGNVLVFPSIAADVNSYNTFFGSNNLPQFNSADTSKYKTAPVNDEDPFYSGMFEKDPAGIDMPKINYHYKTSPVRGIADEILQLENGDNFITRIPVDKGFVYLSSVPLSEKAGNFTRHALFVPVILRIAEWSQNSEININIIGRNEQIDIRRTDLSPEKPFEIKSVENDFSAIPEMRNNGGSISLFAQGQITEAGNYMISYDDKPVAGAGFNYERSESDLSVYSPEEIREMLEKTGLKEFSVYERAGEDIPLTLESIDNSKEFWKFCLIAALVFLLTEILLLRFLKE